MPESERISQECEVWIYKGGQAQAGRQWIVTEVPLTIVLDGHPVATLFCSPHLQELLAVGFLVSDGVLNQRDDLEKVTFRPGEDAVWVDTHQGAARWDGLAPGTGHSRAAIKQPAPALPQVSKPHPPPASAAPFNVQDLLDWVALLDKEAETFRLTGGVHEAALADKDGFVACFEDISRHSALDRVLGYTFLHEVDTSNKAIVLSCRISCEILAKVARIGAPVVVSRAAPTSLAIQMAEELDITLVGFVRDNNLYVFTHRHRIAD